MCDTSSAQFIEHLRRVCSEHPAGVAQTGEGPTRTWEMFDLSAESFADEAARFSGLERITLPEMMAAAPAIDQFAPAFLRDVPAFPHRLSDGTPVFALADPTDQPSRRAAELVFGVPTSFKVASIEDIAILLDQKLGAAEEREQSAVQQLREDDIESLRDLASGAPVVRAVTDLIEKALEMRASDIHIEPFSGGLSVRLRIDGLLRAIQPPAGVLPQAVISRIKIIAGLNIAERRLPQDGAARIRVGREIDVRVAIMPTQYGESAVLRLLPKERSQLAVDRLGLSGRDEAVLRRLITVPHGMIVVTGPTGSGKTTTLATIMSMLNVPERKILTVEDPVEYDIPGINQSQIKPAIGLTFASALRSFVRQDPDVIMVGEIRDSETANVAIHAALTGHLVLTTMHAETAAAAVPRLLDLGVEGYLLRSTLRGVIAQRLVRQLCDHCKAPTPFDEDKRSQDTRVSRLGLSVGEIMWQPRGCARCGHSGYRGRIGVFELLELSSGLRELIADNADGLAIDQVAIAGGMTTMLDDGIAKCRAAITAPAEIVRVVAAR